MTHYDVKDFNNRLRLILLAFGVRLDSDATHNNRGALDSVLSQHAKGNNMCTLTCSNSPMLVGTLESCGNSPVLVGILETYVVDNHRTLVLYATYRTDAIVRKLVLFFESLKHYAPLPFDTDTLVTMAELTLLGNTHS